jgi:hypothetical protein
VVLEDGSAGDVALRRSQANQGFEMTQVLDLQVAHPAGLAFFPE